MGQRIAWVVLGLALLAFAGCRCCGPCGDRRDPFAQQRQRDAILRLLHQQELDWNAGNVEAFMAGYWNSPELTFCSGGEMTKGWQETLDRYRRRYPDASAMGKVAFTELLVKVHGDVALATGRWRLERQEPVEGLFTLILRKLDGQWVIIHDHTSRAEG